MLKLFGEAVQKQDWFKEMLQKLASKPVSAAPPAAAGSGSSAVAAAEADRSSDEKDKADDSGDEDEEHWGWTDKAKAEFGFPPTPTGWMKKDWPPMNNYVWDTIGIYAPPDTWEEDKALAWDLYELVELFQEKTDRNAMDVLRKELDPKTRAQVESDPVIQAAQRAVRAKFDKLAAIRRRAGAAKEEPPKKKGKKN